MPPRQGWNQGPGRNSPSVPSPLSAPSRPTELPSSRGSPAPGGSPAPPPAADYYEDVDPRFADPPGGIFPSTNLSIPKTNAYEDTLEIPPGAPPRSPAESDRSNFTSISQRGINPRWNPSPPPLPPPVARRPVVRPSDIALNSNPDFELPTRGSPGRNQGGMIPGSAYPTGRM